MPLPLKNLDDLTFDMLVEEARALIPVYARGWTDHNLSDPGITLTELFAWMAEQDIYRLNRVGERHQRKMLRLLGGRVRHPRPARTVISVTPRAGAAPFLLPRAVELDGTDPRGELVRFQTIGALPVVPLWPRSVLVGRTDAPGDITGRWERGEPFAAFGEDPRPGDALYLGFAPLAGPGQPLPDEIVLSLYVRLADDRARGDARRRLRAERTALAASCQVAPSLVRCDDDSVTPSAPSGALSHHDVRLAWEVLLAPGRWQRLDPARRELFDETRAFTLDGRIVLRVPPNAAATPLDQAADPLLFVRCRLLRGAFDAVPIVERLVPNGVEAIQAATPPDLADVPLEPPVQAARIGVGTGRPLQQLALPGGSAVAEEVRVYSIENGEVVSWSIRSDLDSSGPADPHAVLSDAADTILFGDGEHGRAPRRDEPVYATYRATRAERGNLATGTVDRLASSPHNQALLAPRAGGLAGVAGRIERVTNPVPATGGAPAETVDEALARVREEAERPTRAITLADYEALALATPGARVARASARAGFHPDLPCARALGVVTVIVLPYLPRRRPTPSEGLRRAVAGHVGRYRPIGTRLIVVGPTYQEIAVRARVRGKPTERAEVVRARVVAALDRFFDPLVGGGDGNGWPFGRDVYRSEVLQVLDDTPGVEHVAALELLVPGRGAICGNVCLGPLGLVATGAHEIEVV